MSTPPRIASTLHNGQYGSTNNAGRRRPKPTPVTLLRGGAQGLEHTNDRSLDAIQRRVADSTAQSRSLPLAGGNVLYGITFVANTPITLQHGLGRAFVSCLLCGQSASGSIAVQRPSTITRPLSQQNVLDERQITITPTFSGVADVLVW